MSDVNIGPYKALGLAGAALLSFDAQGAEAAQSSTFPSDYQGLWAPSEAACEDAFGVQGKNVWVGSDRVRQFWHEGDLQQWAPDRQLGMIKVTIEYSDESGVWQRGEIWRLGSGGKRLTVQHEDSTAELLRCEAEETESGW